MGASPPTFDCISGCCGGVVHARLKATRSSAAGSRCAAIIFRRLVYILLEPQSKKSEGNEQFWHSDGTFIMEL